jgi:hypothetical protein
VCFVGICCAAAVFSAQQNDVIWDVPDTMTAADRRAIVELARRVGIRDPVRVSGDGDECPSVRVEARLTERGRNVSSAWAWLKRADHADCTVPDAQLPRNGRWFSFFETAHPIKHWRIRDGTFFVDVQQNSLGYELVERIVHVTRSMKWVEQCSGFSHTASDIWNIHAAPQEELGDHDPNVGTHWISTKRRPTGALLGEQRGHTVIIAMSGPDIQFVRCSTWES